MPTSGSRLCRCYPVFVRTKPVNLPLACRRRANVYMFVTVTWSWYMDTFIKLAICRKRTDVGPSATAVVVNIIKKCNLPPVCRRRAADYVCFCNPRNLPLAGRCWVANFVWSCNGVLQISRFATLMPTSALDYICRANADQIDGAPPSSRRWAAGYFLPPTADVGPPAVCYLGIIYYKI